MKSDVAPHRPAHATPSTASLLLVFVASVIFLSLGFERNQWNAAEQGWFETFQLDSESLVIGRLCKSRRDGLLSAAGLTGSTGPGIERQYREYLDRTEMKGFGPYRSQPGFQADLFALLDPLSPLTPRANLDLFRALTAAFSACALALLVVWFQLEFGMICAITVLLTTLYSPWLTVMGRNLWWCLGAFYLPLIGITYGLLLEERAGWSFDRFSVALTCAAVLSKCVLNGFEFATTTVVMVLVPYVYYALRQGWTLAIVRARSASALAGLSLGVSIGLCVLAFQLWCVDGSLGQAWSRIGDSLYRRTAGRLVELGGGGLPRTVPGVLETLSRYGKGAAIDLKPPWLQLEFRQLIFLFLGASALALRRIRSGRIEHGESRRILGLIGATWVSILGPLAWFVVFMGHATVHFHLDHVVWHMPFTILGWALCGVVLELTFRRSRACA